MHTRKTNIENHFVFKVHALRNRKIGFGTNIIAEPTIYTRGKVRTNAKIE